mmetsp:Transcript_9521/g.12599  ORF Transcript_9521/g.12599 Transcript_9521/m.12599 type:complete len:108 (-) Transcript_9521:146-469(-)
MPMSCIACGDTASEISFKNCSVCRSVQYCSVECQKGHWPSHKGFCTKTSVLALFHAIQTNGTAEIKRLAKTKRVVNGKVDYTPTDWENAHEMKKWTPLHECIRKNNS